VQQEKAECLQQQLVERQREQTPATPGVTGNQAEEPSTSVLLGPRRAAAGIRRGGGVEGDKGTSTGVDAGCGGGLQGMLAAKGEAEAVCDEGTQTTPLSVFKRWSGGWAGPGGAAKQVRSRIGRGQSCHVKIDTSMICYNAGPYVLT
jgi:hypothetical protein